MIINFLNIETEESYLSGFSRRIPNNIQKVAIRKLDMIDAAEKLEDLKSPPANRLESLKGDLNGFYSIRINDRYRIVFKFKNGNAHDVYITDYHN
ncbi:MAG: type II toxin-antitoxin system RelE/ParE family toxin [Deltaproteobacteria bacterium]|jgi:proteic killer suppression protein|nr:type II toxin-antitoxin system RelE/ParE family toxin [Deltaproteobacteria bacterium]